jgi:hypothetical protein
MNAEGFIFIVMLCAIMPSVVMLKVAAAEATGVLQNYCNFFSTQNKKVFFVVQLHLVENHLSNCHFVEPPLCPL